MREQSPTTIASPDGPALVLSGGGALGALQAGLLRALFRTGFRPSMVVGTSAGAINGAFLAFHPDAAGADELVEIWRSLRSRQIFAFSPMRIALQLFSGQLCLARSDLLKSLIADHAPIDDFAATAVPLYITTTNLTQARKEVFHAGAISRAVLASAAIPGLFCPVEIDHDLHVDGGVIANLDIETAYHLGATEIVAIDLSRCLDGRRPNNIPSLLMQTLDVVQHHRVDVATKAIAGRVRLTLVQPNPDEGFMLGSLASVDRLVREGEELGDAVVSLCMRPDGTLEPGMIHGPMHLHPWASTPLSTNHAAEATEDRRGVGER
jgi:NTE family protein